MAYLVTFEACVWCSDGESYDFRATSTHMRYTRASRTLQGSSACWLA
jgi:hypothetical protein